MEKKVIIDGQRMNLDEYLGKVKPKEMLEKEESVEEKEESLEPLSLEEVNLNDLTVADLKTLAQGEGLEVGKMKKAELIELLEEHRAIDL